MKVLFVATVVKKHIMEFHIPYLRMFKEMGWETTVAARNDYENPEDCNIPFCDKYYNIPFERSPFNKSNITAYKNLKKIIETGNYNIIHCHTPVGAFIGRLAAKGVRKNGTKVFYTAHGFHFYDGAPFKYWALFYPVERQMSKYTDVLITINKEDYLRAKNNFYAEKTLYIPGVGIDTTKFNPDKYDRDAKRKELGLKDGDVALLSVGELITRKNHRLVIQAIGRIKENKSIHYFICGSGPERKTLQVEAEELGISDRVHFLGYRNDIPEICCAADLFVFMSYQEGLPVALMEAMSCGTTCIASKVRGNVDLITNNENGYLIPINTDELVSAIINAMNNRKHCKKLGENARKSIQQYDIINVLPLMKKAYLSEVEKG